jgi:hypothetical protein
MTYAERKELAIARAEDNEEYGGEIMCRPGIIPVNSLVE